MATKGDGYLMTRGVAPSNRLLSQHYLWKAELGWNLHPAAQSHLSSSSSTLNIAEVATGNGIWIIEEARNLPPGSQAYGFDISQTQFPSPDIVPENVTFQILDIKGDIPTEFQSRFDVVHIRLVIAAVHGNDPSPILRNLLSMLKPGGILQWSEIGPILTPLSPPFTNESPSAATKIMATMAQTLNQGPARSLPLTEHWIYHLKEKFADEGFQGVEGVEVGTPRKEMWKFWCDNCAGAMEELVGASDGIGAEFLDELAEERERGSYWWFEPRVVVGRKPV